MIGAAMSALPAVMNLFGGGGADKALEEQAEMKKLLENIKTPEFAKFDPEAFQYSGDYRPEEALYQTIQEDPRLKNAQISALNRMSGLSDTGLDAQDEVAFARARNQSGQIMRSGNQAAMQNAEARGIAGSGMELAMRQQAAQDAAQNSQMAGMQQADTSARQRMLANQAFGDQASSIRNQDLGASGQNTDIINKFNQMNTGNRNQAQQYNLGNRQANLNMNTVGKNDAFKYNQGMQQQTFDNTMTKTQAQMKQSEQNAKGQAAKGAADNDAMSGLIKTGMSMFGM